MQQQLFYRKYKGPPGSLVNDTFYCSSVTSKTQISCANRAREILLFIPALLPAKCNCDVEWLWKEHISIFLFFCILLNILNKSVWITIATFYAILCYFAATLNEWLCPWTKQSTMKVHTMKKPTKYTGHNQKSSVLSSESVLKEYLSCRILTSLTWKNFSGILFQEVIAVFLFPIHLL